MARPSGRPSAPPTFPARRWAGAPRRASFSLIGCWLVVLTGAAAAQESPELPAKADTAPQPVTPQEVRFSKGKGPGRGNSFLLRYEEDYAYLRDPARST